MATNTAQVLPPVRNDPRQVVNTLKKTINYNDPNLATGVPFDNSLPQGAFILNQYCEVVTAFNGGTTNTLTVGTVGPAYTNLMSGSTAGTGITGNGGAAITAGMNATITAANGRALTAAGDVTPFVKYVQTGTPATTGQAIYVIIYEGGWPS